MEALIAYVSEVLVMTLRIWSRLWQALIMSSDEHYNEPGGLPDPLEDNEPNDMPATRGMFIAVLILAGIALAVLALYQIQW